jgi:hypothetical protein
MKIIYKQNATGRAENIRFKEDIYELLSDDILAVDAVEITDSLVLSLNTDEYNSAYDAQAYSRNRALAYDSIGNQLDMIYKDNLNGTTTHKASVKAVKAQFPKPE